MLYSQVLGTDFYKIGLAHEDQEWVDTFFTSAGHHYWMVKEAIRIENRAAAKFHFERMAAHVLALKTVVYARGDFRFAKDWSQRNLDRRETWNPTHAFSLPDPEMFNSFRPDQDFAIGENHLGDTYILDTGILTTTYSNVVSH